MDRLRIGWSIQLWAAGWIVPLPRPPNYSSKHKLSKCVPDRGQTQDRFGFLPDVKNVFVSLMRMKRLSL